MRAGSSAKKTDGGSSSSGAKKAGGRTVRERRRQATATAQKRRASPGGAKKAGSNRARAPGTAAPAVPRHAIKATKSGIAGFKREIMEYMDSNGYVSWSAKEKKYVILGTNSPKGGLVECPDCKIGQLMVIRSRASGKRFMGCSNFYGGCEASSPLLQRARLRATKKPCEVCRWPIVIFRYSRNQKWTRQCANINCPSRNKVRDPGQDTRPSACS